MTYMSQILASAGISVQHPSVHPTTGRKGNIATCKSFMFISHTHKQALLPHPTFLFPGGISLIVENK